MSEFIGKFHEASLARNTSEVNGPSLLVTMPEPALVIFDYLMFKGASRKSEHSSSILTPATDKQCLLLVVREIDKASKKEIYPCMTLQSD